MFPCIFVYVQLYVAIQQTHAEELSERSYREDISLLFLKCIKVNSDSDREVKCNSLFSEAKFNQNLVDTTARMHTVEWNNFIRKVALNFNILSKKEE